MTDTRAGSSLDLTCDNTTVDSGEPVCWPRAKEINSLINLSSRSWYFITWNNVMWNRVMTLFSLPLMKLAIFPPRFPIPETGHITHLIITSFRLCRLSAYCKMLPSFPWSFPLFFHVIIVSAPVQIVGFFLFFYTWSGFGDFDSGLTLDHDKTDWENERLKELQTQVWENGKLFLLQSLNIKHIWQHFRFINYIILLRVIV